MERDSASSAKEASQVPFEDDDKESFLDEPRSSPDSSPDCHIRSRTRLAPAVKTVAMTTTKDEEKGDGGIEVEGENNEGEEEEEEEGAKNLCGSDVGEGVVSDDRESTTATPPSSRSPSLGASTTTISSSDNNAPDNNFSQ